MARPGMRQHPKFKRLLHLLREPAPHVVGYLECLWETGYAHGEAVLGREADVELAAEYPGTPGRLAAALEEVGLIDRLEDGRLRIHDLYENAPEYVRRRMDRRAETQADKICGHCGEIYHSPDPRSRYCSPSCRVMACRNGKLTDVNGDKKQHPLTFNISAPEGSPDARKLTDVNALPSPAQSEYKPPQTPPEGGLAGSSASPSAENARSPPTAAASQLAELWCTLYTRLKYGKCADRPADMVPSFAELLRHGHTAESLRAALEDPARDRGEWFSDFRERVMGGSNGQPSPRQKTKTERDQAVLRQRAAEAAGPRLVDTDLNELHKRLGKTAGKEVPP